MREVNPAVQQLREAVLTDQAGQVLRKPQSPPMRQMIRGGWAYREVSADPEASASENEAG